MPKDYIPVNDADFEAFVANFAGKLNAYPGKLGLAKEDMEALIEAHHDFSAACRTQRAAEETYRNAIAAKKRSRTHLEQMLRPLVRRVNAHPGMSDTLRASLGVTISSRVPSHRTMGAEVPALWLERENGFVVVHLSGTPQSREARSVPLWAIGWNIYRKTTEEPEYALVAFVVASPFVEMLSETVAEVSYCAAFRGQRATDIGALSPEQTLKMAR